MATERERDRKLLREARERYETAAEFDRDNREEAVEDLKFFSSEQWPREMKSQREAQGRPCLTINTLPAFVRQVTGEARQNPPAIRIIPGDGDTDPKKADLLEGMIRYIEARSTARDAYNTALEGAAICGIGNFRVLTEIDDNPFEQEIRIERVSDHLSVVYDPDARRISKSDGRYAFVTSVMEEAAFKSKYPDAREVNFERDSADSEYAQWFDGKRVRVAEYWRRVPITRRIALLDTGKFADITDAAEAELAEMPITEVRDLADYRVEQFIISGMEVLSGPNPFPCRYIPIIPVIGEEISVEERTIRRGMVRMARDPQRILNYWRSSTVEMVALAPRAPYLLTPGMISGAKRAWDNAHTTPTNYLIWTPDQDAPGAVPARLPQPDPPAAMWQEAQIAIADMKTVTGIHDASLGAPSNETSGKAILARQREGDVGTFVYIDNLRHAVEQAGRILVDMIPKVYDTPRVMQIIGADETSDPKPINTDDDNKLHIGKYSVRVSTGPSYTTKRIESADQLMQLVRAVPGVAQVAADLIVKTLDVAGGDEIVERLRATLPPQIANAGKDPSPEEQQAMQQAQAQETARKNAAFEAELMTKSAAIAKDTATAKKTQAQAEGQQIDNAKALLGQN